MYLFFSFNFIFEFLIFYFILLKVFLSLENIDNFCSWGEIVNWV